MRGGKAGRERERKVADYLRAEGWVVVKGTTYGTADLVALKSGVMPMLLEVKSTAGGPYERFGPAARDELELEAIVAGAKAVLAWYPPRKPLQLIPSWDWPGKGRA